MSRRLLIPLIVLVVTVAGLLGCAAWNRGEAYQRLTLTEREIGVPWQWRNAASDDDGIVRFAIEWQRRDAPLDERAWLTEDRLREIGFDLSVPAGAPGAQRHYERALPRTAWVVLEYDGPAWEEIDRRRRLRHAGPQGDPAKQSLLAARKASRGGAGRNPIVRAPIETSRLVPVDAGRDRAALARRHSHMRTLILPATFSVAYVPPDMPGGPLVYGYLRSLVTREVTLPRRARAPLADLRGRDPEPAAAASSPRFEVDLAVGRLGFPWVVDVRRTR